MKIVDIAFTNLHMLDAGRLDSSRKAVTTLVVSSHEPVLKVLADVERLGTRLVLVTHKGNEIVGLISPSWVKRQVEKRRRKKFPHLSALLEEIQQAGQIFPPQKWLNETRPPLHWCVSGSHYTDENPCSLHEH